MAPRRLLPIVALLLATVLLAGCDAAAEHHAAGLTIAASDDGGASPPGSGVEEGPPLPSAAGAEPPQTAEAAPSAPEAAAPVCPAAEPSPIAAPVRVRTIPPPVVGAAAAVVIDGGSGAVLWGREEHTALQPASVTKIVTALIAVERGNLDEPIPVQLEQRLLSRGTTMGLVTGDWFTLRDLLYGLMLPSGNDAATVIAYHFAGGDRPFADLMNERLCRLGLTDSTFINPSGLGRGEYNLASAYDLAQVSRVAMEYPAFRELAAARSWVAQGSRTLWLRNLNELVSGYPGADGVKIGWTPGAGNTIVASATRNGHRVIVALLRTPNRAGESAALLDWAFATFRWP